MAEEQFAYADQKNGVTYDVRYDYVTAEGKRPASIEIESVHLDGKKLKPSGELISRIKTAAMKNKLDRVKRRLNALEKRRVTRVVAATR